MSISELALVLENLSRNSPQSADPRIREVLTGLLPHSRELLQRKSSGATEHFRSIGRCLVRLRGSANAGIRLALLHDSCRHLYLAGSAADAIALAEHGVALARRTERSNDLRRFLGMLGTVCGDIGDRGRSIELHSMALELSTKLGDRDGQCKAWSNLSVVFGDSGLYAEATACAARALELISPCDTDADDKRARVLTNMALARLCLGDVAEAAAVASLSVALTPEQFDVQRKELVEADADQRPSLGCNIKWSPGNEPDHFAGGRRRGGRGSGNRLRHGRHGQTKANRNTEDGNTSYHRVVVGHAPLRWVKSGRNQGGW